LPNLHADVVRVVVDAISGRGEARPSAAYSASGGVALIDVCGVIVTTDDPDNAYFGLVSCQQITRDVTAALNDPGIGEIVMHFCSPGGSVLGLAETAGRIEAAAAVKPVTCFGRMM